MKFARYTIFLAVLAAAGLNFSPASAAPLPTPSEVALPDEGQALADFTALLTGPDRDRDGLLAALNQLLSRLDRPTRLRGLVQFHRGVLLDPEALPEARQALAESIRLLPEFSGPLLAASSLEAYADQPSRSADYLLRAAEIDPDTVRTMSTYDLRNLLWRLYHRRDRDRLALLSQRLLDIGWSGDDLALLSSLTFHAIRGRMAADDLEGARALVRKIVDPRDAYRILYNREYEPLWEAVDTWAGPRQAALWPPFLGELRARWRASGDAEHARAYAGALDSAKHYDTLISEFLPAFERPLDAERDYALLWVASSLADALVARGRWSEAEQVFERPLEVWRFGADPNALNLAGNRARIEMYRDNHARAVEGLDRVIADAERWGGQVGEGSLATMHFYRACALAELGRDAQARESAAFVLAAGSVTSVANVHLCLGERDAARQVLLAAIEKDSTRSSVLSFMQPGAREPIWGRWDERMAAARQTLRKDPELLRRTAAFGRVLDYSQSAGAPPDQ